jgi:hypothetical protein
MGQLLMMSQTVKIKKTTPMARLVESREQLYLLLVVMYSRLLFFLREAREMWRLRTIIILRVYYLVRFSRALLYHRSLSSSA